MTTTISISKTKEPDLWMLLSNNSEKDTHLLIAILSTEEVKSLAESMKNEGF